MNIPEPKGPNARREVNDEARKEEKTNMDRASETPGPDTRRTPPRTRTDAATRDQARPRMNAEPVIAYRLWRAEGGRLYSLNTPTEWPPGRALVADLELPWQIYAILIATPIVLLLGLLVAADIALSLDETEPSWVFVAEIFTCILLLNAVVYAMMALRPVVKSLIKARLSDDYVQPGERTPGIYAVNRRGSLLPIAWQTPFPRRGAILAGTVYLWGTVDEYDGGYKAQYAYPKSITAMYCPDMRFFIPFPSQAEVNMGVDCLNNSEYTLDLPFDLPDRCDHARLYAELAALRSAAPEWFAP